MRAVFLIALTACSLSGAFPKSLASERFADDADAAAGFNSPTIANIAPIANAGADIEVVRGDQVKLDGRRSFHPFGAPFTVRWSQVDTGDAVALANAANRSTAFTAPAQKGTLQFKLVATSESGFET